MDIELFVPPAPEMNSGEDSCKLTLFPMKLMNLSSSSSTFFSANPSPPADTTRTDRSAEPSTSNSPRSRDDASSSDRELLSYVDRNSKYCARQRRRGRKPRRSRDASNPPSSFYYNRRTSCDVYIGFHGRKPSLIRFTNWLRAELEVQGVSCFTTDRARCRNSRKRRIVENAMIGCTFGVVIVTKKSFRNPYTIEEIRHFAEKKNLVPVYFDLAPNECLVRDIIEKRGEVWEKHGGELWLRYGGVENEWREAVGGLKGDDDWKLDAHDGKWRDCILRAVALLASRLGRRSVVDRIAKWREKAEREEFVYPRNERFIGRKKELFELEFMLFGDVYGDVERDYFEIKTRARKKNSTRETKVDGRRNGKEPIVWKESEKEIEVQNTELSRLRNLTPKSRKHGRRRSTKVAYGKGIACVTGDPGIGKTELLVEFAYRYHQRYKMVLWIGGESRYIRQNYLNLSPFLEIDVGEEKGRPTSFDEQEEAAVARVRRELMRDIPFLVVIDNLESEIDWWDRKLVMDLLPRFGGDSHVIISTRLPRVMNIEPLRLSYLSGVEAMSLMQGSLRDQTNTEIDALQAIEAKIGRLTLGLAIVGAILSELPITPSRLLDAINRTPPRDVSWTGRDNQTLRRNGFLLQLFEVCFSVFDHTDGPQSLATRMVLASGWFAPAPIPIPVLAVAAHKLSKKHRRNRLWQKILYSVTCGFSSSYAQRSEAEASSLLFRFKIARSCTRHGFIQFNELVKAYARRRATVGVARLTVQAIAGRGSIPRHGDHMWAACFLILGFDRDSATVELRANELLFVVKEVILPLAIRTFVTFSRCRAATELLRLCTEALEAADEALVVPVEKWLDKSLCWRPVETGAQLNPCLWQDLAVARATVLEVRAKLMMRGGAYDAADDLIRTAIFIRTSVCGEDHPDTAVSRETLAKVTRLLADVHSIASP
ncbi:uncharacterized protein LOC127243173 [Andrographis paniculata]|uniref:uncharacterized protein LOC127243173 n=1 Tax=Andrographis paniculata TaxID=175694 RepID=UPI0021E863B0|nr:uncharacterized protein LOC127243173 [Andrographis paniculata]